MAPPKFGDLGKGAKDLIGKDYHHPLTKVELNSKTSNDVALKAAIDKNNTSNEIKGNFEAKFAYKPLNATITEKFNTSNVISQVITFADKGIFTFFCFFFYKAFIIGFTKLSKQAQHNAPKYWSFMQL